MANQWNINSANLGWKYRDTNRLWGAKGANAANDTFGNPITVQPINSPTNGISTYTVSLDKEIVNNWISSPSTNYGLLFVIVGYGSASLYSSDMAETNYRPTLSLTYQANNTNCPRNVTVTSGSTGLSVKWIAPTVAPVK